MAEAEPPAPTCRFYLEGRCHFGARCRLPHPGAGAEPEPHAEPSSGPVAKKASMRTAQAVIDRIRWDPHLDPADFSVGYLDRFRGVLEEPFTAFCWDEELAALGPGVLAVPQHRIRYFRHRGRLVWDRATRTDLVFGSAAGGGTTILDGLGGQPGAPGADGTPEATALCSSGGSEVGSTEQESEADAGLGPSGGPAAPRPTHFVAVMLGEPGLREAVGRAQSRLLAAGACAGSSCLVGPEALHLTLVLLRLAGPGEVTAAAGALRRLVRAPGFHAPRMLHFQGLACRDARVIYSVPSPGLEDLRQALARGLEAEGLQVLEATGQIGPHLTLAKVPRGTSGHLSLPEAEVQPELGSHAVEALQLCSVGGLPEAGGSYSILAQVPLGPATQPWAPGPSGP